MIMAVTTTPLISIIDRAFIIDPIKVANDVCTIVQAMDGYHICTRSSGAASVFHCPNHTTDHTRSCFSHTADHFKYFLPYPTKRFPEKSPCDKWTFPTGLQSCWVKVSQYTCIHTYILMYNPYFLYIYIVYYSVKNTSLYQRTWLS